MTDEPIVYLLVDEPQVLKALTRLLHTQGLQVRAFTSSREFLAQQRHRGPACLVLEVAMPELDGLEVQKRLRQCWPELVVVFLTGRGDIPTSVRAIKAGADNFLTKPVISGFLLQAVRAALQRASDQEADREELAALQERLGCLTPREREVFDHVIAGKLNKQIAAELGTGEQNIKIHRGRLMRKMGVGSVAGLVRAAEHLCV